MSDLVKGKRGLIMDVANEKSIAWGIAREMAAQGVELAVCIASGIKRGVLSEEERARYEKTSNSLAEPFTLVGLGQLISAINEADRYIEFPA